MQIEVVKLDVLTPDPQNMRIHSEKNLAAIRASLVAFGQQIPLVVNAQGIVLKGNGTLKVMRELGWKEAVVHRTTLGAAQGLHFSIADNRAAELAEWDLEQLSIAIQGSGDFADNLLKFGWTNPEIEPLRLAEWNPKDPLEVMPGTTSITPPPSIFLDFTEKQLAELAAPLAFWRERHPSIADKTDPEVLVLMAEQWLRWEKKAGTS